MKSISLEHDENGALPVDEGHSVSFIRDLIKSSGIYAIASLASPLLGLVLAPFLTHTLSHSDYGALTLLTTVIVLLTVVTQSGLGAAFFRVYGYDYESQQDRLQILSTVILLLLLISLPVFVAILIAAPWLSLFLFHSSAFSNSVRLSAGVMLIQNLTVPGLSWLRAENRANFFTALSISNLLVALIATIILISKLHMGIEGSLLGTAGGYAFVVTCTLPVLFLRTGFKFNVKVASELLSFGLPIIFSALSSWVLQLSDRYLLSYFVPLAQVGLYNVAYILGGVLTPVIITPFSLAWSTIMYSIAKKDNAASIFQPVFRWFSMLLLFAAFGLSLLSIVALHVFFPPAYSSASPIIPLVALSGVLYGMYNIFASGISIRRKTWLAFTFTALAAITNIILNLIFIPFYGIIGAAVSTLIAYGVLAFITYVVNQRIFPVPFDVSLFLLGLVAGVGLYVGAFFLTLHQVWYIAVGIYACILTFYGGYLIFLGKPSKHLHLLRKGLLADE